MLFNLERVPSRRFGDPQFAVQWEPRRQNFGSSLGALLSGAKPPKEPQTEAYFRECQVGAAAWWFAGARKPKRALLASVLWHTVLITFPFPVWKHLKPRSELRLPRIEVTWYAPVQDLPLLAASAASKPSLPGAPEKPMPRRGADAFHPRQTIISAPEIPTHPRQTLIQPHAPLQPPKILPQLPNIVEWAERIEPTRPRFPVVPATLAKLRPNAPAQRTSPDAQVPQLPKLENRPAELNIASSTPSIPKPQLPLVPASVPRAGPPREGRDGAAAPDIGPTLNAAEAGVEQLVALSPAPGASAPNLPVPAGNLAARFSISPEGTEPGVPGGSPSGTPSASSSPGAVAGDRGSGPPGVSISGGHGHAAPSFRPDAAPEKRPAARLAAHPPAPDPVRTRPAPGFDRIQPGGRPEEIFGSQRVYTLHVNMPNLASVTGSWILSFVEMQNGDDPPREQGAALGDLSGPVPLRKVDPKYPPALIHAHVQGEVVLYAIIRRDGSVDSIQLVKGIEPELDQNAMKALARWKFRPGERQGAPVELEAVVHIPFRAVAPVY
ncbi:MAG TPA: TonB family protein [Candidatus Acidoferrales bacterium]|nr:TonB family protein [Candidatus Acidoferrales bacterium]